MDADRQLTFEGFSLDLANERLLHEGKAVALTPKAFAVLRREGTLRDHPELALSFSEFEPVVDLAGHRSLEERYRS